MLHFSTMLIGKIPYKACGKIGKKGGKASGKNLKGKESRMHGKCEGNGINLYQA